MRLLDRYLLRELLIPLGYCLGGFLIFYCFFDFISNVGDFQKNQLLFTDCLEYYLVTTPEKLVLIMPIGLLLALLYALTNHCRHNELTAMRAAGISLWRLSLPYLCVGALFCLAVFGINELWSPQSQDKAERIMNRRIVQDKASPQNKAEWHRNLKFYNGPENRHWLASQFNLTSGEMIGLHVLEPAREIHAERAVFANNEWLFYKVNIWKKLPGQTFPQWEEHAELKPGFWEPPDLIKSDIKVNSLKLEKAAKRPQLSIVEIHNYLRLHPQVTAAQKAMLMTQLHGRMAEPVKCLIVVLIAVPFGARSGRRNVAVGVAGSIFICFGFFILQSFSLTLGTGAWLPPVIAAWLPNVAFGAAGIAMTLKVR